MKFPLVFLLAVAAAAGVGFRLGLRGPADRRPGSDPRAAVGLVDEPSLSELAAYAGTSPPGSVEVIVLAGRTPLAGVEIDLVAEGDAIAPGGVGRRTDALGRLRVDGLPPGIWRVGCSLEPGVRRAGRVPVRDRQPTPRVLLVFGTGALVGRVTDASGAPVPNARVEAMTSWSWSAGEVFHLIAEARADDDGTYRLERLQPGYYHVVVRRDGEPAEAALPAGEAAVTARETSTLALSLR